MSYATAKFPKRYTVLGFNLRPFSLGHALMLEACESRFVCAADGGPITRPELLGAALICSRSFTEAQHIRFASLKMLWWRWRTRNASLTDECDKFFEYLHEGHDCPKLKSEGGRAPGGPYLLRLVQWLRSTGLTEAQALDYPLAAASWEWATYWEEKGAVKIRNKEEQAFLDWCDEQDRLEAEAAKEKAV